MTVNLYNGIKFPFQKSGTSFPAATNDDALIRESLIQLILTANGERVMRPNFGTNARAFVFENNDAVLGNLLRSEVKGVVAKYEPRVQLTDIQLERKDSQIIMTLIYIVLNTRLPGAVAVPLSP